MHANPEGTFMNVQAGPPGGGGRFLRRGTWLCRLTAASFLLACSGSLALAALYNWPDVNPLVYYFIVRPAWVWFGALVPALAVGVLGVRRRWLLLGCGLFLVCLVASEDVRQMLKPFPGAAREEFASARMGLLSYLGSEETPEERLGFPLRIISWNIAGGISGSDNVVGQLAELRPDIVLLQECWGEPHLREALAEREEFAGFFLDGDRNMILSRFSVVRVVDTPLSEELGTVWKVDLTPHRSVVCINLHLSPQPLRTQLLRGWTVGGLQEAIERSRVELENVERALDFHGREDSVVLAGDFNLPSRYAYLQRAVAGLKDCYMENGYGWGKTAPVRLPAMRVDMIFVPNQARVYYAAAVPTSWSDHYMIIAEVVVPTRLEAVEEAGAGAALGNASQQDEHGGSNGISVTGGSPAAAP